MFKTILKPFASLRLTVILLVASIFLVFAGTMAQVKMSNYDAQERYFHSQVVWINFSTLLDRDLPFDFNFPFPGGYIIGGMLLVNLLAAHSVRFKLSWKRSGIILTHLGLILLLVGEGISSRMKTEGHMSIEQGSSARYTYDLRDTELAVVDPSPKDKDIVTVIPENILAKGGTISAPSLPFKLRIDAFYPNTDVMAESRAGNGPKATAGGAVGIVAARGVPRFNGTGENAARVDAASVYVTPMVDNKPAGTYLCSVLNIPEISEPQEIEVGGKTYTLQLHFKRTYKPYTIYLNQFRFDRYTGTKVPKNFSSDIRLVDTAAHEDRLVHIWMNHPLRYNGETFFQSGYNEVTEHGTVLQVVSNPAWTLPYISCAIGGLGLLIHFGITLVNFLNKRMGAKVSPAGGLYTTGAGNSGSKAASSKSKKMPINAPSDSSVADWAAPAVVAFCAVVYLISQAFAPPPKNVFDLHGFSQLPISHDGRIQPLDTTARVALRSIRGKEHITVEEVDEKGNKVKREMPAAEWLADVIARPEKAADYKCFRVDWPELAARLSNEPGEKYFSPNQVFARWNEFAVQIIKASESREAKKVTDYQKKLLDLSEKIQIYLHLGGEQTAVWLKVFRIPDAELRQVLGLDPQQTVLSMEELMRSDRFAVLEQQVQSMLKRDDSELTPQQLKVVNLVKAISVYRHFAPEESLRFVPPQKPGDDWHSLEDAVRTTRTANQQRPADVESILNIEGAYTEPQPEAFNNFLASYQKRLDQTVPVEMSKARYETAFNAFDPFTKCMVFYVTAFVMVCLSWLGWSKPLYRSAGALLITTLIVHTWGLDARIYISGRPPVTNLASSAIFIAWGIVVLSLGFEFIFRNSIGFVTAAIAGFSSLLIADRLAIKHGDTLKVLQAVLDTNFWLATHVVCVTLGYASTFLAGLLGIIYIFWGLFTPSMKKEDSKELARMIYGVVCFAMFFSFVGTILGGIWADQSWGRFWGWDTKENGAVLVVLCNAVLLHARWGGLIKERGIAVLAVVGNIITTWSWFGTNELGIGLHAYGFTEGVAMAIWVFVASQALIIGLGLIPRRIWASQTM